jgi:hypothetical protein
MSTSHHRHLDSGEIWQNIMILVLLPLLGACGQEPAPDPGGPAPVEEILPVLLLDVRDVGFSGPESVLHDMEADVYLVANINGELREKDGNGFVSRLSPEGEVLELRWIDGQTPGVTLDAPGGMALVADTLFVTDIDCIRGFHRLTGEPVRELCMEEGASLDDLASTRNGNLYFSESGSSGSPGAVFLLRGTADVPQKVALADGSILEGEELGGPNGLEVDDEGLVVATFRSGEVFRVTLGGQRVPLLSPSPLGFEGLVALGDGTFLVSSRADSALYRITAPDSSRVFLSGLEAPADIGLDRTRDRLLVPLFHANRVRIFGVEGSRARPGPGGD